MFTGKPLSRTTKAGVNLVEDEQRAVFVAKLPKQRQKLRRRNVDATARLHRFDKDRADLFAAENLRSRRRESAQMFALALAR